MPDVFRGELPVCPPWHPASLSWPPVCFSTTALQVFLSLSNSSLPGKTPVSQSLTPCPECKWAGSQHCLMFCSCTLLVPCPRILVWYSSCFSNSESLENRTFYLHQLPTCMQDCFAGFLMRHFCFSLGNRPVCLCFQKESSSS